MKPGPAVAGKCYLLKLGFGGFVAFELASARLDRLSPWLSGRRDRLFSGFWLDRVLEVGVLAYPVAVAAAIGRMAVMHEAIDQRARHHLIT